MIAIEFASEDIFPSLIIGYEVPTGAAYDRVMRWDTSPDWIVTVDHQYGGMCMTYDSVAGAILRLADNADRIRGGADFLVRGFHAMAEDPRIDVLRQDYPILHDLVCTAGDPYSSGELQRLEQFLRQYITIPRLASGFEAFIRLEDCDVLHYFEGWRTLQASVLPTFRSGHENPICHRFTFGLEGLALRAGKRLDRQMLGELKQLGALIGDPPIRAFFLWENCD